MECNLFWHELHVLGKHASLKGLVHDMDDFTSFLESHFMNTDEVRLSHS
jgi:hypothetical protein